MPETPSDKLSPPSRPRGVRAVKTRRADGTEAVYWYCRLTGTRLPDIEDPGFAAAVAAARKRQAPTHQAGTLGAMLEDWRGSQEYIATARATKIGRERYMKAIEAPLWAARQVVDISNAEFLRLRSDLLDLRDAIARQNGIGAASVFAASCAAMFSWAVERGRMIASPLAKLKSMGGGHIPPWTEDQAQHAMATWPEHLRRAVILAYHLGQRRGDLAALRWDAYQPARGIIMLQPEKTRRKREAKGREPLRIIVPKALAWHLTKWREEAPDATHILQDSTGKPWRKESLIAAICRQLAREGWDTKMGMHGLRKLRANQFAEAGVGDKGIMAAQGWDSTQQVRLYTQAADQEKMARAAVDLLEKKLAKAVKKRR